MFSIPDIEKSLYALIQQYSHESDDGCEWGRFLCSGCGAGRWDKEYEEYESDDYHKPTCPWGILIFGIMSLREQYARIACECCDIGMPRSDNNMVHRVPWLKFPVECYAKHIWNG